MSNKYSRLYAGAFLLGVALYVGMLATFLPAAKEKYTPWLALWICLAPAIPLLFLKPAVERNAEQVNREVALINGKIPKVFAEQALFLSETGTPVKRMLTKYVVFQLLWGVWTAYMFSFVISIILVFFKII